MRTALWKKSASRLAQFLPQPVYGAVLGAAARRRAGGRVVDPGPGAAAPSFYRATSSG